MEFVFKGCVNSLFFKGLREVLFNSMRNDFIKNIKINRDNYQFIQ